MKNQSWANWIEVFKFPSFIFCQQFLKSTNAEKLATSLLQLEESTYLVFTVKIKVWLSFIHKFCQKTVISSWETEKGEQTKFHTYISKQRWWNLMRKGAYLCTLHLSIWASTNEKAAPPQVSPSLLHHYFNHHICPSFHAVFDARVRHTSVLHYMLCSSFRVPISMPLQQGCHYVKQVQRLQFAPVNFDNFLRKYLDPT